MTAPNVVVRPLFHHQGWCPIRFLPIPLAVANGGSATTVDQSEDIDVLVVDDEDDVRASEAAILRCAGYKVAEAPDGLVALERLRSARVSAVVLDVAMPRLNGLELLDKLDNPPPVVLVTAREYDTEIMARRSKVMTYMQKPFPPASLLAAVRQAISKQGEAH